MSNISQPVALVIGASGESIFAIRKAREMGLYVIAFDGNPEAPGLSAANEYHVTDIRDAKNVISCLAGYPKPCLVLPVPIGRYLITTGKVNEHFGMPGPNARDTDDCTDKYLFHEKANAAGLRNATCHLLKEGEHIEGSTLTYPLIIKPRCGSGSRACRTLHSADEFENTITPLLPFDEDMVIETLKDGVEYGVDGVVVDGKYQQVLVREKILTPYPFRQSLGYYAVPPSEKVAECICQYMTKLVQAMGVQHALLHADIIWNAESEEVFCIEYATRPSGHNCHNLFTRYATDVCMVTEYIKHALKGDYDFAVRATKCMAIRFFSFENCRLEQVPDFKALQESGDIVDYQCTLKAGDYLATIKDGASIIHRGFIIVQAPDRNSLDEKIDNILSQFRVVS